MAQSVQIILEDDLEGGPADETFQFGLDGRQYEIDLSAANAEKLREALRPYAASGRRAQGKSARVTGSRFSSGGNGDGEDPGMGQGERPPDLRPRPYSSVHQGRLLRRPVGTHSPTWTRPSSLSR